MGTFEFYSGSSILTQECRTHSHRQWELTYIERCRDLPLGRAGYSCAGELTLVPPAMSHQWKQQPGDAEVKKYMRLAFDASLPEKLAQIMPEFQAAAQVFDDRSRSLVMPKTVTSLVARTMSGMCHETEARRAASLVEVLVLIASSRNAEVAGVTRFYMAERERKEQLDAYLATADISKLSLSDCANHLQMSNSSFCTFFKKISGGEVFVDCLNRRRIEMVCKLLLKGGITVGEASQKAGFNATSYMIRVFRHQKGCTPMQWLAAQGSQSKS